jgi:hypothetical protein
MERHLPRFAWACLILVCLLPVGGWTLSVHAQGQRPWTPPVQISQGVVDESGTPGRMSHSIVVADEWGGVHAIWSAVFDEKAPIGDTLYYSFWDGTAWSTPADVLYTPGTPIWIPKAAVDTEGWLHLVWTDNPTGRVWYSRAALSEARSALGWDQPKPVVDGLASGVSLAVDAGSILHLIYCGAGEYQGVYHTSSGDGQTWSTPNYVGQVADSPLLTLECRLGQAMDARGRLHAVWGQALIQDTPIYYSRTEDGGASWLPPLEIDRRDERYEGLYTPGRPSILAVGPDEVHLVWFGAPIGQRWHRWSADGGDTWSPAEQLSPIFRGFMEPPALAADSSGTVHLLSMGWLETEERLSGLFHTYWREGRWSRLEYIDTPTELVPADGQSGGGEYAALAVSGGNTLHAVWELGLAEIWASRMGVDAPVVVPKPPPSAEIIATPQVAPTMDMTTQPAGGRETAGSTASPAASPVAEPSKAQGFWEAPLFLAVLPVALLLSLVALVRGIRWRR